ncbi:DUF2802 domain-containing protein [Aliiglaciecola sp. LCG003]|uniref:DUF2802 domain-containing protein n=1 Tax=Aliiglaciecola sp. LCG003 TaxID=3053655 RepID=UPI002573C57D|nr:DUF2802 domain-containing protein [Aliiglaciecola sp. LCG003]WJG08387.1 DUF2802 domain-containing protein [Aliiglaciecola sp. LCG003]
MTLWVIVLLGVAIVLSGVCLATLFFARRRITQLEQQHSAISEQFIFLQQQVEVHTEELNETRVGAHGLSAKVKELLATFDHLKDKIHEIENQDPDTRLYSHATKLANGGASVEELMRECDLPRAEAELLVSIKKGRSS